MLRQTISSDDRADIQITVIHIPTVMVVKHESFLRVMIGSDISIDVFAKEEEYGGALPALEVVTLEELERRK